MTAKQSKLILAVEYVYLIVKASVMFWLSLVKRGIIYGWVTSCRENLFYLSSNLTRYESYSTIVATQKMTKGKLDYPLSLGFSLSSSLTLVMAMAYQKNSLPIILFSLIVSLTISLVFWLFGLFYSWLTTITTQTYSVKEWVYLVLYQLFHHPALLGFCLSLLMFSLFIFWVNKFLWFFILPGLFFDLLKRGFKNIGTD